MPTLPQEQAINGVGTAFAASTPSGLTPDQQAAYAGVQKAFSTPTVLSNSGKIDSIAETTGKLNSLANKGTTQSPDGTTYHADGTVSQPAPTPAYDSSMGAAATPTTATTPEEDQTNSLMESMKASLDAQTKAYIDNIHQQFEVRRQQQTDSNTRNEKAVNQSLLLGGSARYAPISSQGIVSAQETYGIQAIQQLDSEENTLIANARSAQQDGNFQIMEKQLALAEEKRKEKVAAAQKLNESVTAATNKARDQQIQSSRDNAIAGLVSQGITDPKQLLDYLNHDQNGNTTGDFTIKEVTDALKSISTNVGTDSVDKLTGDVKNFQILKGIKGGLPASLLALPEEQQMPAYLKMINKPDDAKGTYQIKENADGTQTVFNTATGQVMSGITRSGGKAIINSSNLPEVAMTGSGEPNGADQKAFLATLSPETQALVKGLADYSVSPTTFPTRQTKGMAGLTQQQILTLVKQYDPTYDEKQYATRASMQKNVTSGTYSQAVNAANKLVNHLSELSDSTKKLRNMGGGFTPLNWVGNAFNTTFGGSAQRNFDINRDAVASEAAKVFKGVGSTDQTEVNSWKNSLSSNSSPKQLNDGIKEILDLMGGQLSVISDQYKAVMGKPAGFTILTPRSIAVLRTLGVDPSEIDPTYQSNQDAHAVEADTRNKILQFHDASPQNATLIDQIHAQFPDMTAQEISDKLGL